MSESRTAKPAARLAPWAVPAAFLIGLIIGHRTPLPHAVALERALFIIGTFAITTSACVEILSEIQGPTRYQRYMRSARWRRRRLRHLRRYPSCAAHPSHLAEQVHHRSYWAWRHLGKEAPGDLWSVCKYTHDLIHQLAGRSCTNERLRWATDRVIAQERLRVYDSV